MKKNLLLVMSFLMIVSTALIAQNQNEVKPKGPTIEQRVEKMAVDLELSSTEKANLQTLLVKQAAEMKKFRSETDQASEEFKDKMKEMRKTQESELKAVIGEEKYAKLLKIRAEQRKK